MGGDFLITAQDPAGPWSDPVWLDDADRIDPSLFFDDDGRSWYVGTRPSRNPVWDNQTDVWLRELDICNVRLTGPEHLLWHGALVGAVWAEGPHLYKAEGRYYLLAAEGGTEHHHAVCVARSDEVTGPYTGNPGNPVLTHRNLGRDHPIVGTGHADLVQLPGRDVVVGPARDAALRRLPPEPRPRDFRRPGGLGGRLARFRAGRWSAVDEVRAAAVRPSLARPAGPG